MPIKPENRARYPADWKAIRAAILERAGNCCEWQGCGVANHAIGYWIGATFRQICMKGDGELTFRQHAQISMARHVSLKVIEIVLTIAHLDHTPEHCDDSNLMAMCQRHHLAYDQAHHTTNAYMTRKAKANTLELPL